MHCKMMTKVVTVLMSMLLGATSGCVAIRNARQFESTHQNRGAMPAEFAQPRLGELLNYLSQHGITIPEQTSVFGLSFWGMYGDRSWEEHPRHPRYEGAAVEVEGMKVIFAISPAKSWVGEEADSPKIIKTYATEDGRPNGASIVAPTKKWTVGYTMEKGDAEMEKRLTALLLGFFDDWTAGKPIAMVRPATP